ncbi:hypothetical protein SS05631_c10530 [Sinorhizobium sp. CCBAU 05631]|nr:hypothetical protein SS05631_c10530 [Sinorhizobium sp. CCBAU 05631]
MLSDAVQAKNFAIGCSQRKSAEPCGRRSSVEPKRDLT